MRTDTTHDEPETLGRVIRVSIVSAIADSEFIRLDDHYVQSADLNTKQKRIFRCCCKTFRDDFK